MTFSLPKNPNNGIDYNDAKTRVIYLAGGCFWGVEAYFSHVYGVKSTVAGYCNGFTENPKYKEINQTGHAETVRVEYDPARVTLESLLTRFFSIIDSTLLNRQGGDIGTQYRTGIYYEDTADLNVIEEAVEREKAKRAEPVVTEVQKLLGFYNAEEYHQDYLEKNPNGYCHVDFSSLYDQPQLQKKEYTKPGPEELKKKLTPMQYRVTQLSDTEPPFRNEYYDEFSDGIYVDIVTGEPLFLSSDKFESSCGWPSFSKPVEEGRVKENEDISFGRIRTEVKSASGNSHLGHVFEDGPADMGGLRYCINSAAVRFVPLKDMEGEGYGAYIPRIQK